MFCPKSKHPGPRHRVGHRDRGEPLDDLHRLGGTGDELGGEVRRRRDAGVDPGHVGTVAPLGARRQVGARQVPAGLFPAGVVVGAGVPGVGDERTESGAPATVGDDDVGPPTGVGDLQPGDQARGDRRPGAGVGRGDVVARPGDLRSGGVRLRQAGRERDAGSVHAGGADRRDGAGFEAVAAVAGVDVDGAADVVVGDAVQLDGRGVGSGVRDEHAVALELALPPRVRRRPADGRVGDAAPHVGGAVAEPHAERVAALAQLVGDVVGPVLAGELVVGVARGEDLVGERLAVERRQVQADPGQVQPGAADVAALVHSELPGEERHRLVLGPPRVLDPAGRSPVALLEQTHLPGRRATPVRRPVVRVPDPDPPHHPLARDQALPGVPDAGLHGGGDLAGVPDQPAVVQAPLAGRGLDLVRRLPVTRTRQAGPGPVAGMAGGPPGLGHPPGQQGVGVIDTHGLVVPAVDPQVDNLDVGSARGCGRWRGGAERLSRDEGQGHTQPREHAHSMPDGCHW